MQVNRLVRSLLRKVAAPEALSGHCALTSLHRLMRRELSAHASPRTLVNVLDRLEHGLVLGGFHLLWKFSSNYLFYVLVDALKLLFLHILV